MHSLFLGFEITAKRNAGAFSPFSTKTIGYVAVRRFDKSFKLEARTLSDLKSQIKLFHSAKGEERENE